MTAAASAARIAATRNVTEAELARRKQLESLANKRGEKLPGPASEEAVKQYRERITARVQTRIPANMRGVAAGSIADAVLKESIEKVPLDGKGGEERMNIDLAVGLAQQAGVSREELQDMLKSIDDPADKEAGEYLRSHILPRVRARDQLKMEEKAKDALEREMDTAVAGDTVAASQTRQP
jgi:hypothetical protein